MYTSAQAKAAITLNVQAFMFTVAAGKVNWHLRNMHKDALAHAGVVVRTAEDFAALRRAVRVELAAQGAV